MVFSKIDESAQFYRLLKKNPAFDSMIAALRKAMAEGTPIEVWLASITSDVIEDIKPTGPD